MENSLLFLFEIQWIQQKAIFCAYYISKRWEVSVFNIYKKVGVTFGKFEEKKVELHQLSYVFTRKNSQIVKTKNELYYQVLGDFQTGFFFLVM